MSTGSAVGLSADVRLLRTLKTVLPVLNLRLIAPPSPVPGADEADPREIRVVLLDADYPDTDALLKWLEPDRPIPAILMRTEDGPISGSLRGASAFLAKPVDPNKLRAAIELVVLDWEMPAEEESRPDRLPDMPVPAGVSAETELDRVLGPALAEIGIPAGLDEWPRPRLSLPRIPAPPPLQPRSRRVPSVPGERLQEAEPAPFVPEKRSFVRDVEAAAGPSAPARKPGPADSFPEETETVFSTSEAAVPVTRGASVKRILAAGLAVFMLAGAGYLVFGRKTARRAEGPAAVSPPAGSRLAADGGRISRGRSTAEPAAGRQSPASSEKSEAPVAGDGSAAAPKPTPPEGEGAIMPPAAPLIFESETGLKTAAPGTATAKGDPQATPPAEAEKPAAEPPEKAAPAVPPAPDKSAAETKETPEIASRPAPAKTGDLIALAEVDIAPALLNSVDPVYPPQALRNKQSAKVALRVLISEKGEILQAEAEPGGMAAPAFVNAALKAVRRWRYSPAYKNGAAVRVWKSVIIDFRIV